MTAPDRDISEIEAELDGARDDVVQAADEVARLEDELAAAGGEDAAIQAELDAARDALTDAEAAAADLEGELADAEAYADLEADIAELEARLEDQPAHRRVPMAPSPYSRPDISGTPLRTRMRGIVGLGQMLPIESRIDLRGRQRCVTEQFLD